MAARTLHPPYDVRHAVLSLAVICAACAGDGPTTVEVEGAPLLIATEGAPRRARVTLDPAPDGPLDPARFSVEALGAIAFETAAVEAGANGEPELVLVAACSQVLDRGDILVPLRVSDRTGAARPADLMLLVGSGDQGACAPTVDVWMRLGPSCDEEAPPSPRALAIPIVPREEPQALCVAVTPPGGSVTTGVKLDSTAPRRLVGDLPVDAPLTGPARFELPVGDSRYFRGEFELAWEVLRAEGPPLSGVVKLLVGDPGDLAISVHRDTVTVDEFAASESAFRTWVYDANEEPPCVTAFVQPHRAGPPPLPRRKPALAVYTAAGVAVDGWGCGTDQFFFRYSPPIDADPTETVYLVACRCADDPAQCDARCLEPPDVLDRCDGDIHAGDVAACIDVPHAVGNVADELGGAAPFACADVTGDGFPELATSAEGALSAIAVGGRLVARFPGVMRERTAAGWIDLPMAESDLALAAALPDAGSPGDRVAVVEGGELVLRCLDGCPDSVLAPLADTPLALAASPVGVVAFHDTGAAVEPVTYPFAGAPIVHPAVPGDAVTVGAEAQTFAVPGEALLRFLDGGAPIVTPGAIRAVDGLVVATSAGVHRLDGGLWRASDPVVVEDALLGVVVPPPSGYGAALHVCDTHATFATGAGAFRVTRLDIDVALP